MKSIITVIVSFFLFISSALNAQNVVFIFSAPEGEEIIKINEDTHEKSVSFFVTGINSVEEVSALVNKMAAVPGVRTFTISEEVIDGKRAASGTFEGCGSMVFFRNLLVDNGVQDLIINGEPLKSIDLEKVWKTTPIDIKADPTHTNK